MKKILLVVEGQGDSLALPVLTRRLLHERFEIFDYAIDHQRRRDISHLKANNWAHFRRYLEAAYNEECRILWTLDADDDCAWEVAAEITRIVDAGPPRQPFAVALWVREFETLFLHDIGNTRETLELPDETDSPADPEGIRGAKGWISKQLPHGQIYKEMVDQPRLAASLDLALLENESRSFRHFANTLQWLIRQECPAAYPITPVNQS